MSPRFLRHQGLPWYMRNSPVHDTGREMGGGGWGPECRNMDLMCLKGVCTWVLHSCYMLLQLLQLLSWLCKEARNSGCDETY